MRLLTTATLIIGAAAALPAADSPRPLAPNEVTWEKSGAFLGEVPREFPKQTGAEIEVASGVMKAKFGARFKGEPFWESLQKCADATNTRITLSDGGRKVQLVPRGKARDVAATSGAFRVVAQQVVGRALLDQGVAYHEVHLLVHWEPRLRVYRIDSTPKISAVKDVPGAQITAEIGGSQILPLNATSEMRVKLYGLTRDSEKITSLSGTFSATAAERMLAFAFEAPDGKLPEPQSQANVTATLKRVQKKDDTWEIELEVNYPPGQPVFESFQGEWWLRDNRLVVRSQEGKSFVIDDFEVPAPDNPRPLRVIHRFKEDAAKGLGNPTAKGWSIVYETPAPLADVKIPFELKGIVLP